MKGLLYYSPTVKFSPLYFLLLPFVLLHISPVPSSIICRVSGVNIEKMSGYALTISKHVRMCRVLSQVNKKVAATQVELKRFIAYTEIFLMLIVIWNTLS